VVLIWSSDHDTSVAIVSHYGVPVKPPVRPVQAATLVLVRDHPAGGLELLLIKRHTKSKFAAGDHVFPGGKVEASDLPADAARWCHGLPASDARAPDFDAARAMAHRVGVIRETFEEVGVLLARDAVGAPARLEAATLDKYRRACHVDHRAFWTMVEAEAFTLPTDALVYFAHWITPEESPLRFDTRFFAAVMPEGQEAVADGHEIVDLRWLAPEEALEAAGRGEISLRNATMRNVQLFVGASSTAAALERLALRAITMIRPRIVMMPDGARQTLMPGDPGYW
jgi:8-oxo-dGTP pyrophosphatase MutT (NUDIX family)